MPNIWIPPAIVNDMSLRKQGPKIEESSRSLEALLGVFGSREQRGRENGGKKNREQGDNETEFRCYLGRTEK